MSDTEASFLDLHLFISEIVNFLFLDGDCSSFDILWCIFLDLFDSHVDDFNTRNKV